MNFCESRTKINLIEKIIKYQMSIEGVCYISDIKDREVRDLSLAQEYLKRSTCGSNGIEIQEYWFERAERILGNTYE